MMALCKLLTVIHVSTSESMAREEVMTYLPSNGTGRGGVGAKRSALRRIGERERKCTEGDGKSVEKEAV